MRFLCFVVAAVTVFGTCAHEKRGMRPDGHAPIMVMGDHIHKTGELMLSYRYMRMTMDGNRDGSHRLSEAEIVDPSGEYQFRVAPTDMDMEMHMFGAMYAPSDRLTLMAMIPYTELSMNHLTRSGHHFSTDSSGLGDIKISGLYSLYEAGSFWIHLNMGLSFPTGSISKKDQTPMGRVRLPYPMQLGSGTYDFLPGITFHGQSERWSWGGQALATIRLGENSHDYTLGDRLELTTWVSRVFSRVVSGSLRLAWEDWGNIDGADPRLNPALVPTADPHRRGGRRLDLFTGLNLRIPSGFLKRHRLAIEAGRPLYQDFDGPQLETDWKVTAGWQYMF